jgi:hypothetical protein
MKESWNKKAQDEMLQRAAQRKTGVSQIGIVWVHLVY